METAGIRLLPQASHRRPVRFLSPCIRFPVSAPAGFPHPAPAGRFMPAPVVGLCVFAGFRLCGADIRGLRKRTGKCAFGRTAFGGA